MAAKLKSISKQIHWSLVLKAGVFALAWLLLPFWLFFLIALYLYFVPLFHARKLAIPFFFLLLLAFLQPSGLLFALIFGAVFYAIFLVKDLLVIDRRSMYELLVLALSLLFLRFFYMTLDQGITGWALWYAFLGAAALAILVRSFLGALHGEGVAQAQAPAEAPVRDLRTRIAAWLSFALFFQALITGLFLPLDFIYQSTLIFLVTVLLVELFQGYFSAELSRKKVLATLMTVFALFVFVLGSAQWGL